MFLESYGDSVTIEASEAFQNPSKKDNMGLSENVGYIPNEIAI